MVIHTSLSWLLTLVNAGAVNLIWKSFGKIPVQKLQRLDTDFPFSNCWLETWKGGWPHFLSEIKTLESSWSIPQSQKANKLVAPYPGWEGLVNTDIVAECRILVVSLGLAVKAGAADGGCRPKHQAGTRLANCDFKRLNASIGQKVCCLNLWRCSKRQVPGGP